MTLLDRLLGPPEPEDKIPVHQWMAGVAEFERGHVTAQQFFTAFELTASEKVEATNWFQSGNTVREEVHDALLLGEAGYYSKQTVKDRLGF
jgi:hypothetical protein